MGILNPYYMELEEWADRIYLLNSFSGTADVQKLNDPNEWQDWALNFVGDPDLLGQNCPDPFGFEDWREWASALFLTFEPRG